jgi:hypothetical protein
LGIVIQARGDDAMRAQGSGNGVECAHAVVDRLVGDVPTDLRLSASAERVRIL